MGINTEVAGGRGFGEAGERQDWLAWSSRELRSRLSWAAGGGQPLLLNKASSPHLPQKNPEPRALMDLGTNGAQSEMASNTGL